MAVYEQDLDRIVIRVVYDGPGRAGKTTNIQQLARLFGGDAPDLHLFAADNGHTVFFDWFAFDGGMIDGHHLLIQIVGVPGAKRFEHRRAHILRSADAVVLVCDSAPATTDLARETLDSLREHLGKRATTTPIIVQANKQDIPGALQAHEVGAALGLPYEIPVIGAEATAGIGTRETAVHAIRSAVRLVKRRTAKPGLSAIRGDAGTVAGLRAALEATTVGDPGPDDDEPLDLPPEPAPAPGRKVYRPTTIDEPHLVYMNNQSGPVQAARIRVGEPGDAEPAAEPSAPPDPGETLPSHAVIVDDPDLDPDPDPERNRKSRRRDTETTESRARTRKDRPATPTAEPRAPSTRTAAGTRKIPPRRRAPDDDVPTQQGRPPSGSVRVIDDTPAARSRVPSGTLRVDVPTPDALRIDDAPSPRERPPSGSVRVEAPSFRERSPSGAYRVVPDVPPAPERSPSGAHRVVPDVPPARERSPSGAYRVVPDVPPARERSPSGTYRVVPDVPPREENTPIPRERPPSGSVRVVDDRGRPPSGSVRVADLDAPVPRDRPPSSSVRVADPGAPVPRDHAPSGTIRFVDDRPPSGDIRVVTDRTTSGPVPRFLPPSPTLPPPDLPLPAPAQPHLRPPDGPLPVRASQPPTPVDDVSVTAPTLPPEVSTTAPTLPPTPVDLPASTGRTLLPLSPQEAAALGLPGRPTLPPTRYEDDLSPRPSNLSPRPDESPTPDIPPGHVWPIPGGRGVLKSLAAVTAPRIVLTAADDRTTLSAGTFHLTAERFPDEAEALAALRARARAWQPVASLLPRGLALAVDTDPDGAVHLYRVAHQLPPLADHLLDLALTARMRLLDAHALALGHVFTLCRNRRVVLDLDPAAYAVEYGRIVYVRDRIGHADTFPADAGPALLGLARQLADDPTIDGFIDALARELSALVELDADLGLGDALAAAEPRGPAEQDARVRLLAALGRTT